MMEVLVLAKARDGSTSLRSVFESFFLLNKKPPDWGYVSNTFELWPAIKDYIREGSTAALYDILSSWPQRIEVSHGLGFVLPIVRSVFGKNLRIIHVQRDRSAHIRSLSKRVDVDPQHWIGYSPGYDIDVYDDADFVPRPTAVDYEEMSKNEWLNLSVEEKFGWFLDKQSELTQNYLPLFSRVMEIKTEDLNNIETLREIGNFVDPDWFIVPQPVHIHRTEGVDISSAPQAMIHRIEQHWEQLDFGRAIMEPGYAANFVLDDLLFRLESEPQRVEPILIDLKRRIAEKL
jgi:hypothetical protein